MKISETKEISARLEFRGEEKGEEEEGRRGRRSNNWGGNKVGFLPPIFYNISGISSPLQ